MIPPRLECRYFGADPIWTRMARVLEHTARQHAPHWQVAVTKGTPSERRWQIKASHARNTEKMECWRDIIVQASDGDRILLIDADTMITGCLDAAWDVDFDIGYTVKPPTAKFPFNSGVVFVRVSGAIRQFFEDWLAVNVHMLEHDRRYHQTWRKLYGGINQAALGAMLNGDDHAGLRARLSIQPMPCAIWNCEDTHWSSFDPATTRILHCKSGLRDAIFKRRYVMEPAIAKLSKLWMDAERAAMTPAEVAV